MREVMSDRESVLEDLVDLILPNLTPYEFAVYVYLLRKSLAGTSPGTVRVGKRTIAKECGRGSRGSSGPYAHIGKVVTSLAGKGYVSIGDTTREGTFYVVRTPVEFRPKIPASESAAEDWYRDPVRRKALFERDGWQCRYCGDAVSGDTVTLDHIVPVWQGGADAPENLATSCLMCNSTKSGRSYREAAPDILESVRARRSRSH